MNGRSIAVAVWALMVGLSVEAGATTLRGTVRDAVTLQPVSGAVLTVQILDPDSISAGGVVSGADGGYEIQNILGGNKVYALWVGAAGYGGFYARLDALDHSDLVFDPLLTQEEPPNPNPVVPDSGTISGTVFAQASSGTLVPVVGASVTLQSAGLPTALHTDGSGHYSASLPLGSYGVLIEAAGYQTFQLSGVALEARGNVVDGVLRPLAVPASPATWGKVKASYR